MRSPGGKTKRTKEGGAISQLCTNSPRLFWKAKAVSAGRALPYRGRGPHPPQCAHWGTFPLREEGLGGRIVMRPYARGGKLTPSVTANPFRQLR